MLSPSAGPCSPLRCSSDRGCEPASIVAMNAGSGNSLHYAQNSELSLAAPWPVPQWLPNETFFSLASRYHAVSGNRLAAHTNLALFGLRRSGNQHDFPSHLDRLVQRTQEQLGSAEAIAKERTILNFYLPARTEEDAAAALRSLTGAPNGVLKYRLGMLTSRFRANHPLKACPACMDEDAAEHGVAYWHRTHQWPGVWVCRRHGGLQHEATLKSTGVQRFGWLLPATDSLRQVAVDGSDRALICDLTRFALLVEHWSQLLPAALDVEKLGLVFRATLRAQGMMTERRNIGRDYCQAISRLRVVPELAALPATSQAALHQVNRWVFSPQGNTHPLRQLSFIFWLYRDWQSFWSAYERLAVASTRETASKPLSPWSSTDPRRATVLRLIQEGASALAAAKAVGIDVGTAIAWATAEGTPTGRRPKTLKDEKHAGLITDLTAGTSKAEAATRHGVSLQSVTRLLRSTIGLQRIWHAARLAQARAQARSDWLRALHAFSTEGVSAARRCEPAAYAWLYRNDRDWLTACCVDIGTAPSRAVKRVNWDSRDNWLANEVRQAAAVLAEEGQTAPLKLWQLYQRVPELKAKLGALDRLPSTRKVISELTGPRKKRSTPGSLL